MKITDVRSEVYSWPRHKPISNGLILEYYRDSVDPMHGKIYTEPLLIQDGYVYAPDRPGLGIELNREALAAYRVG